MRYVAPATCEVSRATPDGQVLPNITFKGGKHVTKDPDEIALLDELATTPHNPIGFDPKED